MSLNHHTPKELCSVKYNDLDCAVHAMLDRLKNDRGAIKGPIFMGKTDVKNAFRLAPLLRKCWKWLVMKAQNPSTKEWMYFIDKCLLFGASISCAIFQRISNALRHLAEFRLQEPPKSLTNYLDDYLFFVLTVLCCNFMISTFLQLCTELGIPIAQDKTEWATLYIVFLGILLDGQTLSLAVPVDKRDKAISILQELKHKKKATVKELQSLCGLLNFLNRAIFPGRVFTRRMYAKFANQMELPGVYTDRQNLSGPRVFKLKQHHHVCLDAEFKADCSVWLTFRQQSEVSVNRPMVDVLEPELLSETLNYFTDARAAETLGFGCIFDQNWLFGCWEKGNIEQYKPSIKYLELFALCAAVLTWQHKEKLQNARVTIFCDNIAVVHMVNKLTSSCRNCMYLLRILTLNGLIHNHRINVKYVKSAENYLSDALSRGQISKFKHLAPPQTNQNPDVIHPDLWPLSKLWQYQ